MSNATAVPDAATAFQTLCSEIDERVFFSKMASYGYEPRTVEQRDAMLAVRYDLRSAQQANLQKQAAEGTDPYAMAHRHLRTAMGKQGLDAGVQQQAQMQQAQAIKAAAAQFARDPALYNSVLVLKQAQAEEIKQELLRAAA